MVVKSKINSYDLAQCAPVIHSVEDITGKNIALEYNRICLPKDLLNLWIVVIHRRGKEDQLGSTRS